MGFIETLKKDAMEQSKKNFKRSLIKHIQENQSMTLLELAQQLISEEELASGFKVAEVFHIPQVRVKIDRNTKMALAEEVYSFLVKTTQGGEGMNRKNLRLAFEKNEQIRDNFGSLLGFLSSMKRLEISGRGKDQTIKAVVVNQGPKIKSTK